MPPFQKGHKKVGGNVKGSKHRSTEIRDYIEVEPAEKLVELLNDEKLKKELKAKIWLELSKYFYKTPKDSIDLTVKNTTPQIVVATQADADILKKISDVTPD